MNYIQVQGIRTINYHLSLKSHLSSTKDSTGGDHSPCSITLGKKNLFEYLDVGLRLCSNLQNIHYDQALIYFYMRINATVYSEEF